MPQTVAQTVRPPRGDPGTELSAEIKRLSGQDPLSCMQCGTCSGSCQFSSRMTHTPRLVLELIRAGCRDEVLATNAAWYCASCYSCAVRCPREIDIPEIMMAIKRLRIRNSRDRSAKFYRIFSWVLGMFGRLQEVALMGRYMAETNPFSAFGYAPFGLKLLRRGKMNLNPLPHRSSRELATLIRSADELEGSRP